MSERVMMFLFAGIALTAVLVFLYSCTLLEVKVSQSQIVDVGDGTTDSYTGKGAGEDKKDSSKKGLLLDKDK